MAPPTEVLEATHAPAISTEPPAAVFRSLDHQVGDEVRLRVRTRGENQDHIATYRVFDDGGGYPAQLKAIRASEPEPAPGG